MSVNNEYGCDYNATGPWDANPVHQHKDGTWWWYDETWADENGPYETKDAALLAMKKYVEEMLGH